MTDDLHSPKPPQTNPPPEFTYEEMRQWGREWPDKVEACDEQQQVIALIESYKPWLDAGDTNRNAFRGIRPINFMQPVADWMKQHDQPFATDSPVVVAFRELITSDEIKAEDAAREKVRLAAFSTVPYITERYLSKAEGTMTPTQRSRIVLRDFCEVLEVHPSDVMSRQRNQLHELTGRWGLNFDADGSGMDEFDQQLDKLPKNIPANSLQLLNTSAVLLITDTLALVAISGGSNAEKLWRAIDSNKAAQKEGALAETVPASSILGLAGSITESINQAGGIVPEDEDGETHTYLLDALPPKDMRFLPEALRRLLYACIDMDNSIEDKDRLAADLDIAARIELIEKYADKTVGLAPHSQVMGSTAVKSATNEQPDRNTSGKPIIRPQLFKPGHGKIS